MTMDPGVADTTPWDVRPTAARPPTAYDTGGFWDEMFDTQGAPRPHYAQLAQRLQDLSPTDIAWRQSAADRSFHGQGITFAVTDDPNGIEKILPFDLVPRLILPEEWTRIERGLEQRVRALNL